MKTALLIGAILVGGCTETHNYYTVLPDAGGGAPDLSMPAATCTPQDVECVGTTSFRECHADGTWGTDIPCPVGSTCDQGFCNQDPNSLPCNPGDGACLNGMAYTCRPNGVGFDVTSCPSGTTCAGAGQCVGACGAAGSAFCIDDPTQIITCDGNVLTQTACPPPGSDGRPNLCVTVGNSAACLPADCNPATDCDVCGSPTDSTIDATTNLSTCVPGPTGYVWGTFACDVPQTCSPTGNGACEGQGTGAGCASQCNPGDQRCMPGNLLQVCGSDGKWGTPKECDEANGETCVSLNGRGVCADPVCARVANNKGATGACVLVGDKSEIRLCDLTTGHLAKEATECAAGTCQARGGPAPDGNQPGACAVVCNPGEKNCTNISGFYNFYQIQDCVDGVWGPATNCALDAGAGSGCWPFTDAAGQRQAVCGVCAPGMHKCDGNKLQGCAADGTWDAGTDCVGSTCQGPDGSAFCGADCVPGSTVCVGNPAASPMPAGLGTEAAVTCNPDGTVPAAPTCPGDPGCCTGGGSCRLDPAGAALGCVICVGGNNNEFGLTDTRCSDAAGTVEQDGGPALQVCNASSTGWQPAQQCGVPNFTCVDPDFGSGTPAYCRDTGLLLYWPFNGDASDASGNGHDGTLNDGNNGPPVLATDACGNLNSAFRFSGGSFIEVADTFLPSGAAPRTLSLWFKTQEGGTGAIADWGQNAPNNRRFGISDNPGGPGIELETGGNQNLASGLLDEDNLWHHAAVTYNGTTAILYVDGQQAASAGRALATTGGNTFDVGVRVTSLNEGFNGVVDEVRIYDHALSPAEITQLFQQPCP